MVLMLSLILRIVLPNSFDMAVNIEAKEIVDTTRNPVVRLEVTMNSGLTLLIVRDTAASAAEISSILQKGYGELFSFATQEQLTPGRAMAFYYSSQPPFIIEVGIEVNKHPQKTNGRVQKRSIDPGKIIVAHYHGPYEQISLAYKTIDGWMHANNKIATAAPFEIYLNDPSSTTDPYELRTDVCQFIK